MRGEPGRERRLMMSQYLTEKRKKNKVEAKGLKTRRTKMKKERKMESRAMKMESLS